ncbi:helix-hairpin-helix domain-containing protein [Halobacillus litoralis]|uniref:helix-hairpin-helix domain-containing protein n=1 Tax=Halobacillus litoralis TaxID=45668 RepID=UPI001CFE2643|nr:helix-hairpin-helix domain-containing protein [Halobacillus litoralis]
MKFKRYGWIILVLIFVLVIYSQKPSSDPDSMPQSNVVKSSEAVQNDSLDEKEIKVDVKGEVKEPGVYTMDSGTRVDDVIRKAGGLTREADPSSVNLAQKLQDEMVISVALNDEVQEGDVTKGMTSETKVQKVRVNSASAIEIQTIKGIGPSKAESIIKYREEHGPFSSLEDLIKVTGIGEKTLEDMKEDILVP